MIWGLFIQHWCNVIDSNMQNDTELHLTAYNVVHIWLLISNCSNIIGPDKAKALSNNSA